MINPATSTKLTHEAIDISIVVPVYNERENLEPLTAEIYTALEGLGRSYEVIFVDDGSQDGSFDILAALHEQDPRLRVIQFRRNFGQTAAFAAGFDHARGGLVITLDADGQNDPADIPRLLNVIENGEYDVVTGWRVNRREPLLRRFLSWTANLLISRGSQVTVHDRGCSLKVFRNDLAKSLRLYGQMHRFLPEIASSVGARVAEVPVNDRKRKFGRSKYGAISRTPRVLLDMITVIFLLGFFSSPMRFFGSAGLVSLLLGFLVSGGLAAAKVYAGIMGGWAAFHAYEIGNRPLLLMAVLMILLGMQFLMMGLLGEMMMRTYYESQNKPPYTIRKSLG
jgi:glycosyltransferase involved in cell wall biosynthesis